MLVSCATRRALARVSMLVLVLVLVLAVAVAPAGASPNAERPTAAMVKRGLTKVWDTDAENSVDKITLTFRSLKILRTRRAITTDFVESAWVTPVTAVFDQRTVRTSTDILNGGATIRSCSVYRVSFVGIFWKGDVGWSFKNRDTKAKALSSQYRC